MDAIDIHNDLKFGTKHASNKETLDLTVSAVIKFHEAGSIPDRYRFSPD